MLFYIKKYKLFLAAATLRFAIFKFLKDDRIEENTVKKTKSYRNIFPILFSRFWRFSLDFNSFPNIL